MSPERTPTGERSGSDGDVTPLLSVEDLHTHVRTDRGTVHVVDGVTFAVERGETVCLVGESGSGKSVTCESITGIVPQPPAEIVGGTITFDGRSLQDADASVLREVRGNRIGHVFQNPGRALDPVYTVGDQIVEAIEIHGDASAPRERAIDLLRQVGIPRASERIEEYPHEFSGGMRQRVAIAIALAADPDLLIADEPTTSVDVTVQARLIELLRELTDGGMALLLVTHDLRVAASLADRLLVMFGGTIVERGPIEAVFDRPAHPYTQALFESHDSLSRRADRSAREEIPTDGCRFRDECPHAIDACAGGDQPPFRAVAGRANHEAACVHYDVGRNPEPVLSDAHAVRPTAGGRHDD